MDDVVPGTAIPSPQRVPRGEAPEAETPDDTAAVLLVEQERRVTELQRRGSEILAERRAADRRADRAAFEAALWKERAMVYREQLRRIDPAWDGTW